MDDLMHHIKYAKKAKLSIYDLFNRLKSLQEIIIFRKLRMRSLFRAFHVMISTPKLQAQCYFAVVGPGCFNTAFDNLKQLYLHAGFNKCHGNDSSLKHFPKLEALAIDTAGVHMESHGVDGLFWKRKFEADNHGLSLKPLQMLRNRSQSVQQKSHFGAIMPILGFNIMITKSGGSRSW